MPDLAKHPSCPHIATSTLVEAGVTPTYDVDYYGDEFIMDPYPHYRAMRELGPVVVLPHIGTYAVTHFDPVREVLRDWQTYASGYGVAGTDAACAFTRGTTLQSDPPRHDVLRSKIIGPLLPGALDAVRPRIQDAADRLVDSLVSRDDFDGIADFARVLPLTIVRELVGLPDDGRDNMLPWASAAFDFLGSQNERGQKALHVILGLKEWIETQTSAERLRPGSWTARIREMQERGEVDPEMAPDLIAAYIAPSLDTTIAVTGELMYQLANRPLQWTKIRDDPSLVGSAVLEAVRMCSPIRSFTRKVMTDTELAGTALAEGSRVTMVFASANRDERKYPDPDEFLADRNPRDQLGFGHGIHMCAGMHLARLEMECLLRAMIPRVHAIETGEPTVAINNTIRAFSTLPARFVAEVGHRRLALRPAAAAVIPAALIDVQVVNKIHVADDIVSLALQSLDGTALPDFTPGAHVDVELGTGLVRQYSLCGSVDDRGGYRIAVKLDAESRGGSRAVHEDVTPGVKLRISNPRNAFALDEDEPNSIFFAAGIGITPILPMVGRLNDIAATFAVHYCVRSRDRAAFLDELTAPGLRERLVLHISGDPDSGRIDFAATLAAVAPQTRLYICGPNGFIEDAKDAARALGWDEGRVTVERFGAGSTEADAPFTLVAARSGQTVQVAAGTTALEALEQAGIEVPTSCRAGVCATCLTGVIEGVPVHHDLVQTDAEKMTNSQMAVCCSRSLTPEIVLDI